MLMLSQIGRENLETLQKELKSRDFCGIIRYRGRENGEKLMKAMIFDIQRGSFVDGPGIRTAVFFKGCNLRCSWCHNPESQIHKPQLMIYKSRCVGCGKCMQVCPTGGKGCILCGKCVEVCMHDARQILGRERTVSEVFDEIVKDRAFYDATGGGVTFTGGECMLQLDFLVEILKMCKSAGIHTAVDTAGAVAWESFEKILPYTDLFLYDIKSFSEQKHVEGTGVGNRLILENLKRLSECFARDITVRIPLIEGYNAEQLPQMAAFLKDLKITSVELLPYHRMGEHKYGALNMEYTAYSVPKDEDMARYRSLFEKTPEKL